MKMRNVVIRTGDLQKSIDFYETVLGLSMETMFSPAPGKQLAVLRQNDSPCKIELFHDDSAGPLGGSGHVSLSFEVEQIGDAEKFLLSTGVRIISPPKTIKDGKKTMTAVDPNGIELIFVEE